MDNFNPKDQPMKKQSPHLALAALLAVILIIPSCRNESVITLRSLLRDMASEEINTRYPSPSYRLVQFSSYDRLSVHPDSAGWFANNDYTQFIREETNEGRREFVLLDAEGPGAIVRWWMTFGNANALNSYIRVYIDGRKEPVIEGLAPQLVGEGVLAPAPLSISVSPLTEPQRRGYNLYLPIPFSEKCKITLENDSVVITQQRRTPSIYYNIDTRLYEEGTRVMSAVGGIFSDDSLAISECASSLLAGRQIGENVQGTGGVIGSGPGGADVKSPGKEAERSSGVAKVTPSTRKKNEIEKSLEGQIPPGSDLSVALSDRGLAINGFTLRITAADTAAALRGTIIRLSFDGKQTAEVPAGNFFGTGYSYNTCTTRFTSADDDGTLRSLWLMPFRDSCRISIFNGTGDTIDVRAIIGFARYEWNENSMHFGALFREYQGFETAGSEYTGGTGLHADINIADLKGRGIYVGDAMLVFNSADAWWGEGDEKIYVDGETFPSSFGTGTEDYFGYAWCRPEPFDHPLMAQPTGEGNFHPGMTVNMRYRILDAIPFTRSLKVDIEMWHWVKTTIDFSTTAYFYTLPEF